MTAYCEFLFNTFNGGLQGSGPPRGLVLHSLHRLQQGRHVGHHHLVGYQRGDNGGDRSMDVSGRDSTGGIRETSCLWWAERLNFFSVDSLRVLLVLCT